MTGTTRGQERSPWLSVIVPVLNEARRIGRARAGLQGLRASGHEVIVVDGGSDDATVERVEPHADRVLHAAPGRARQMNAGAAAATGEVLLFLHVDTALPAGGAAAIREAVEDRAALWGRFDVRLSGAHPLLRVVERAMNVRSRLTGIATGDQALFVRREVFAASGGFPEIALMEDVALSRRLKQLAPPACLRQQVVTSSRRWDRNGLLRTVWLMWRLRLAYAFGADPGRLAQRYYRV